MKKILTIVLALSLMLSLFALAGCGNANNAASPSPEATEEVAETVSVEPTEPAETEEAPAEGAEIAMITDKGTIDDKSFNQGTWEGVQKYAEDNGIVCQYYKPSEVSDAAYLEAISLAIQGGAKVIVTPGFLFEVAIYEAQTQYPDVTFILLDGTPHSADAEPVYKTESNVLSIVYAEQEVGFYAGYAAVKDGFKKLGFQGGMAVPAVVRYGIGFLQGAEAAAAEMGLDEGAITVMYNYSGDFAATPETQARAAGWFQTGTEIIFGCGGSVGNSVMSAAEAASDKFVIGVDVDQHAESNTVIASALKQLGNSVYQSIGTYYDGTFAGGKTQIFDSTNDGVGLAMDNAKWRTFTKADYETVLTAVKNGDYTINSDIAVAFKDLGLKFVKVTEVTD